MNSYFYIIFVIILILPGCASKEEIEKERQNSKKEAEKYNADVIAPIFYLASAACIINKEHNKWPALPATNIPGPKSIYTEYDVIGEKGNYSVTFRLRTSNLAWNLDVSPYDNNDENLCSFKLHAGMHRNMNLLNVNFDIDQNILKALSKMTEFKDASFELTSYIYPFIQNIEESEPVRPKSKAEKVFLYIGQVAVTTGLCTILDIDPYQCGVMLK